MAQHHDSGAANRREAVGLVASKPILGCRVPEAQNSIELGRVVTCLMKLVNPVFQEFRLVIPVIVSVS